MPQPSQISIESDYQTWVNENWEEYESEDLQEHPLEPERYFSFYSIGSITDQDNVFDLQVLPRATYRISVFCFNGAGEAVKISQSHEVPDNNPALLGFDATWTA